MGAKNERHRRLPRFGRGRDVLCRADLVYGRRAGATWASCASQPPSGPHKSERGELRQTSFQNTMRPTTERAVAVGAGQE